MRDMASMAVIADAQVEQGHNINMAQDAIKNILM